MARRDPLDTRSHEDRLGVTWHADGLTAEWPGPASWWAVVAFGALLGTPVLSPLSVAAVGLVVDVSWWVQATLLLAWPSIGFALIRFGPGSAPTTLAARSGFLCIENERLAHRAALHDVISVEPVLEPALGWALQVDVPGDRWTILVDEPSDLGKADLAWLATAVRQIIVASKRDRGREADARQAFAVGGLPLSSLDERARTPG